VTDKREPLLYDRLVTGKSVSTIGKVWRDMDNHVRLRAKPARVFVLDEKAVTMLAHVMRNTPELIARAQEFARQPYDRMWVELDARLLYRLMTGQTPDFVNGDDTIGYFYDHGEVWVVAGEGAMSSVSPVAYKLHQPWSIESQLRTCRLLGTTRSQLDAFLWGSSLERWIPTGGTVDDAYQAVVNLSDEDSEDRRALRASHSVVLPPVSDMDRVGADKWLTLFSGSAGDLRNIITILLLMNRQGVTRYIHDRPLTRGWIGNKQRPYAAHNVVTIDVDPTPVLRRIGMTRGVEAGLRRHEVRGHYRRDVTYREATARGCVHAMEPDPTSDHPDLSYRCTVCSGKRWWVSQFERGDAGKGFVAKTYNVTA